ncbi:CheF family chemotaxis protein [Methanothermococcus sp.]|uniref:CheF family chemotaxis protein n=1 Tax=Methanothermococcus sp. TaxID=2614238 RepID=UPI0025F0E29D|nr:CheF family chemotaxis protein [Methanothermococcus sp.]
MAKFKSKEISRFEGKAIIVNSYSLKDPFTKWNKTQITLFTDKIEFNIGNKKIEANIEYIEDIGAELPRRAIEIAKASLEDISHYSSIVLRLPDRDKDIIGFAPETSLYGKTLINSFLKKIFYVLLNKKEIKVQYGVIKGGSVDNSVKWEEGFLVFAQKPVKKGVSIVNEQVLAVAVKGGKPKVYDLFNNIESVDIENKTIDDGKELEVLEIKQIKGGETITSYIYIPQKERLFVLRYIATLSKYSNSVKNLLPKTEDELESQLTSESWGGDKIKSEVEQLEPEEQEVLTAIYTGISSLELPPMMGLDVDEVEKILENLIDKGFLNLIRIRKETELTEKGRAITNYIISNF